MEALDWVCEGKKYRRHDGQATLASYVIMKVAKSDSL